VSGSAGGFETVAGGGVLGRGGADTAPGAARLVGRELETAAARRFAVGAAALLKVRERWSGSGRRRRQATLAVVAAGLAGAALVAQGLWIPAKAVLAQVLLERAWNRALAGEAHPRPWPWADTWPVARLILPPGKLGDRSRNLIVLAGASGRTLAFGPGHLDGSALPGDDGNVVLVGHRDTHFRALASLTFGDEVVLETLGPDGTPRRRRYRVAGAEVVDKSRTDLLAETARPTLTLVTCWPFDAVVPGGPLRYVVTAVGA
jgi:sortase A